jgi:membrane fusion protein, multidrug efflux system
MRVQIESFLLAALVLPFAGCGSKEMPRAKSEDAGVTAVRAVPVRKSDWPATFEAVGTVRARTAAQISSRVMAYVRQVRVRVGDRVRAGEILVRLDAKDFDVRRRQAEAGRTEANSAAAEADNAVAAARANLELAETTFKRMKDLHDKKSLSEQEFDEASTRVKVASTNLDMAVSRRQQVAAKIAQADEEVNSAQVMLGYSEVTAPFAGVVTEKSVEAGNLATPGAPLMTIEQGGAYRLEVAAEESKMSSVRIGQAVGVSLDAIPGDMQGRVSEIVPTVDPAARSFTVKIDLPPSGRLQSGQFGRARFATGQRSAIVIPAAAVQERGQIQWVYVADRGRATTRMISVAGRGTEQAEVLSGLAEGDQIVYPIPEGLRDGARVEVHP